MPSKMNNAVNPLSVSGLTKARAEGRQNVRLGGEKMLPAERTDEIN